MDPIKLTVIILIVIAMIILVISLIALIAYLGRNRHYKIFKTYPLLLDAPDDTGNGAVKVDPSFYQLYWSEYFDSFLSPTLIFDLENINNLSLAKFENSTHFQFVKLGDIFYVQPPKLKRPLTFADQYANWWIQLTPNSKKDPSFVPDVFFLEITDGTTTYSLDIEASSPDNLILTVEQTREEPFPLLYLAAKVDSPEIAKAKEWFTKEDFGL